MRMEWKAWQSEQPCPEARMLVSEVDLDLALQTLPEGVGGRIKLGLADARPSEQIAAAVELKKRVAGDFSTERLRQLVAHLRSRYRVAIDRSAAVSDANALPPVETSDRDALLGETDSLLERLKVIYTLSSLRDAQIAQFRRGSLWILGLLLSALAATRLPAAFEMAFYPQIDQLLNLCAVALFGAVGSMVSIMRRSQNALDLGPIDIDPVRQISALRHGFSGMLIAAFVGPVLALVLFAVFAGDMLTIAGLTPEFVKDCNSGCSFSFLGHSYGFVGADDAAKMAIWAFLAGFAEQFVPDVLDKFTRAAKETPLAAPADAA